MAIDQSALSNLLDTLRAGGNIDVVRTAVELVLQALIDAEATAVIGADRYERTRAAQLTATGHVHGRCPPRPATSNCESPWV